MELHWTWYALAIIGVYRMITVCFEAVVRRTVHIARQTATVPPEFQARPARHARPGAPPHNGALPYFPELQQGAAGPGEGQGDR